MWRLCMCLLRPYREGEWCSERERRTHEEGARREEASNVLHREREWKREAGRESGLGLSAGTRACAEVPTKIECGGWSVLEAASAREQVRNSTDFPPFSRLCGRARECVGIEMRGDAGNQ